MPQGKLQGGRRPGRDADNGGAWDAERVEQAGVRVGLRSGGCVARERRAQIAEPRHRDDLQALRRERRAEVEALVEAASGPVYY